MKTGDENNMKKIRVVVPFKDKKHDNILRKLGDEIVEENERAELLIKREFASLVEDIIEKKIEVEQAIKEAKKEEAVKEKAVKKNAKK